MSSVMHKILSVDLAGIRGRCSRCGDVRIIFVPKPTKKDAERKVPKCVNSFLRTRGNKFQAVPKTTSDGASFQSTKEARRWDQLRLLEKAGEIHDLRRQVRFPLKALGGTTVSVYVADFVYRLRGQRKEVVEDVKGFRTPVYRMKAKWMKAQYGVEVLET